MADTAVSMAMLILGLLIVIILLRVLMLVHKQTKRMEELKQELKMSEAAREEGGKR